MSSSLPTDSAVDSSVQDFGLGTYDSEGEGEHSHGEDSNEKFVKRPLPDGGGQEVQSPDRLLSYPDEKTTLSMKGISKAELPNDHNNPAARSDYYDDTVVGSINDIWPDSDTGAYAGEEVSESELPGASSNEVTMDDFLGALGNSWSGYTIDNLADPYGFPGTDLSENSDYPKSDNPMNGGRIVASRGKSMNINDVVISYDRGEITLGSLFDKLVGTNTHVYSVSNKTAGEMIDIISTYGHNPMDHDDPRNDHKNKDPETKEEEKHRLRREKEENDAEDEHERKQQMRKATNLDLAGELATEVIKLHGKKGLTKRHILSYLSISGHPQFLSSDVIRCLKHRHEVYVKDVLDEFPVSKQASNESPPRDLIAELEELEKAKKAGQEEKSKKLISDILGQLEPSLLTKAISALKKVVENVANFDKMSDEEYEEYEKEDEDRAKFNSSLGTIRNRIINLEINPSLSPEVSAVLRRTAAALTRAMVQINKLEDSNG